MINLLDNVPQVGDGGGLIECSTGGLRRVGGGQVDDQATHQRGERRPEQKHPMRGSGRDVLRITGGGWGYIEHCAGRAICQLPVPSARLAADVWRGQGGREPEARTAVSQDPVDLLHVDDLQLQPVPRVADRRHPACGKTDMAFHIRQDLCVQGGREPGNWQWRSIRGTHTWSR